MKEKMIITTYSSSEFEELVKKCIGSQVNEFRSSEINFSKNEKLSIHEAAEYLGVTPQTVFNWKKKGLIPYYQAGRHTFFLKSELLEALRKNPKLNK